MRNLIKITSIGVLAVALSACGKDKTSTTAPGGGGGGGGGGSGKTAGGANPAEASKEAKADFEKVVKEYQAAKSDGKLSGDECERVAGSFQRVYKSHGVQMAIAQFNSGVVYEECGQTDKAESVYSQLISQAPKFDLAYNNLGVIYWKKGQESKALDMFKKGVEANKLGARAARNNVAGLLRNQYITSTDNAAFTEAEKSIQGVLALDSGNQAAYENLARIYYDRGHRKDKSYLVLANLVVTQGARVLKTDGNRESAELYNVQGLLLLERDDQVNALKAFKEAVRVEPQHVEANLNIGFISIRFRDYATAESAFKIAVKDPRQAKNVEAWLALGVAQRGLKKFKDAEESYQKAAKLNASDPRPSYNLGVLYQDHISTQDNVDEKENQRLINVAKGHYNKFVESAKSDKQWAQQVLMAKDRIVTIEQTIENMAKMKEMEAKAKELEAKMKAQEEEERKRLLDLERQAMEAEASEGGGGAAPPAGGAAPAAPPAGAAPKK